MMVLLPSDEFEKQLLIKTEQSKHLVKSTTLTPTESILQLTNNHESTTESNTESNNASNNESNNESSENSTSLTTDILSESQEIITTPESSPEIVTEEHTSSLVKEPESSQNNEFKYLMNDHLETVNILDIPETKENIIDLKSHEQIYLEIYKTAKQKAKEIRKNAIAAFLEAKKIKIKYNLDNLDIESSDDDEDFLNFDS